MNDERGDHFACPEFSVDLSVQTEGFLCFQPFSDLGFSLHVFSFLADGLVQFVHATKRTRMLRVAIDLFQVVLISHRLIESSFFSSRNVSIISFFHRGSPSICLLGILSLFRVWFYSRPRTSRLVSPQTVKERTSYPFCIHPPRIPSYKYRSSSNNTL